MTSNYIVNNEYSINIDTTDRNVSASLPVAVRPRNRYGRSLNQMGTLTIHGNDLKPIDFYLQKKFQEDQNFKKHYGKGITGVIVDGNAKKKIIDSLFEIGIHQYSLFGDKESLAKMIIYKYVHKIPAS